MPRFAVWTVLIVALPFKGADAQESDNRLEVSVFGGITTGSELWVVSHQPVSLINSELTTVGRDTFAIRRSSGTGIVIGMAAVLFQSDHFGVGGEASYTGPSEEDECRIEYRGTPSPGSVEARQYNDDLCLAIDSGDDVMGSVSLLVEAWLKAGNRRGTAPFVRLGVGVTDLGGSSAEMSGRFPGPDINGNGVANVFDRPVILDTQSSAVGLTLGAGVGLMIPLPRSYSLRIEARDQAFFRAVAAGPADALSVAQIGRKWFHNPSIVAGFGIRMERRRGRVRPGL